MITLALAGLTDPRHRALLTPLLRRREGIRVVAACDPEPYHEHIGGVIPVHPDVDAMLAQEKPSLVAVTSGGFDAVAACLRAGADVVAAPPFAATEEEVGALVDLAAHTGRTLAALHLFRGHATSRLAKGLIERGKFGKVTAMSVTVSEQLAEEDRIPTEADLIDLYGWLTGRWGERPTIIRAALPTDNPVGIQVVGSLGKVEWQVRTGKFRSLLGDEPVTHDCGRPDQAIREWAVDHLIRTQDTTGPAATAATRILITAGR